MDNTLCERCCAGDRGYETFASDDGWLVSGLDSAGCRERFVGGTVAEYRHFGGSIRCKHANAGKRAG